MKKLLVALSLLVMVVPFVAVAQAPAAKPSAEHPLLAGIAGTWTSEGEATENPFGPAEKWTATITTDWFPGNMAVVRRIDGKGSVSGAVQGLEVIAFDVGSKTYSWYFVDSTGIAGIAKVSGSGTATWTLQVKGKTYKCRGTLKGLGSDKVTFTQDFSADGKKWTTFFRATDTRVKAK